MPSFNHQTKSPAVNNFFRYSEKSIFDSENKHCFPNRRQKHWTPFLCQTLSKFHMRSKYGRTKLSGAFFWLDRKKLVHLSSSVLLPWFHTKLFQTQTETFNPRKSKEMAYFKYSWSHGLAGLCLKVEQEQFPLLCKFLNIDKISYISSASAI